MLERVRRLVERARRSVGGRVVSRAIEDNAPSQAALIAWNGLQTVFPIVLAVVAILGIMLGAVGVSSTKVYDLVVAAIPTDTQQQNQVLDALRAVKTQTGLLAILALVGFLWSASSLFGSMEQVFDHIFRVPQRGFVRQKLMAIVMMALFTLLAGLAVLSSTLVPLVDRLPGLSTSVLAGGSVRWVTQVVIGVVAGFLLFFAIYYVVPNRRLRVRQVLPGAVFAGVAFEVLTLVFPLYMKVAGTGLNQYGATFALLFVLMAFFYFLGLVTMLGVEINAVLHPAPAPRPEQRPAAPDRPAPRGRLRRVLYGVAGSAIGIFALTRRARTD